MPGFCTMLYSMELDGGSDLGKNWDKGFRVVVWGLGVLGSLFGVWGLRIWGLGS